MASKNKKTPKKTGYSGWNELVKRFKAHPFMTAGTMIVMILLVLTFALPLTSKSDFGQTGNAISFGSWNKKPIELSMGSYMARVRENRYNLYKMYGMEVGDQEAFEIMYYAFQSSVIHTAMLDEVKKAGFALPKDLLDRKVLKNPEFYENGRLSAARIRAMSESDMLALRKSVEEETAKEQYVYAFKELSIPRAEEEYIKKLATNRRYFNVAAYSLADYPDSEIRNWGEENAEKFARLGLSKIRVESEKEAIDLKQTIEADSISFADAAIAHSIDITKDRGGSLGIKALWELEYELADTAVRQKVSALEQGQISDPVQSGEQWNIYYIDTALSPANFEDVDEFNALKSYYKSYERGNIESYYLSKANSLVAQAGSEDFIDIAREAGMQTEEIGPVALNYGNVSLFPGFDDTDSSFLKGASKNVDLLSIAFSLPLGGVSRPLVLDQYVVLLSPVREEAADSSALESFSSEYASFVQNTSDTRISSHILESDRLENKFFETYMKTFR